jgi:GWxTD domain-containing protein
MSRTSSTGQERENFLSLADDAARDKFVRSFWESRNPTPGNAHNPFKEEHYRRIAYANAHFASSVPGWKTDRGKTYIVWGPPVSISVTNPRTQTWHYLDRTIRFTDSCHCGEFVIEP